MPHLFDDKIKVMADNRKGWLVGLSAVALGAGIFFYFKNKSTKETQNENKAISDLTTSTETEQAALIKKYLNVKNTVLGWGSGGPTFTNAQDVLRVCLQITDWNEVSKKFSSLCNNEYTLIKALQDGLSDSRYTKALQYAKAKKVVTTMPYTRAGITFPANTILGAYAGEMAPEIPGLTPARYKVINDYQANLIADDKEVIIDVPQDMVKLM